MATNKEIVQGMYANLEKGDIPAFLAGMDPKIEWTEAEGFPLYDGTLVGPQAVLEGVLMRLGEIGDEYSVVPRTIVADGDTVIMDGKYTWKHKVSGEPAEVRCAHVLTLADGKVTAFQQHVDTFKVRELLG